MTVLDALKSCITEEGALGLGPKIKFAHQRIRAINDTVTKAIERLVDWKTPVEAPRLNTWIVQRTTNDIISFYAFQCEEFRLRDTDKPQILKLLGIEASKEDVVTFKRLDAQQFPLLVLEFGNKWSKPFPTKRAGQHFDDPEAVEIIACGSCGAYHRTAFQGDCRDDHERFGDPEDAEARLRAKTKEVFEDDESDTE